MVPRENRGLAGVLKLPLGDDGFFNEIHPKLRPVETVVDGVMIAGSCQSPRTVGGERRIEPGSSRPECGTAEEGRAELEPLVALVNPDTCTGSGECLTTCPYDAITTIECDDRCIALGRPGHLQGLRRVRPALLARVIDLLGYTDTQMRAMIEGLVETAA